MTKVLSSTAKNILVIDKDADYIENVLYIQSNYNSIVETMSTIEKYYEIEK